MTLDRDGFTVFAWDAAVAAWSAAAHRAALAVAADPAMQACWLRHGATWFVGVDALPNGPDGAIGGMPLHGPWQRHIQLPDTWHPAQLSIIYAGYPKRDTDESEAAHRYRVRRCAAHMDGLLLEDGRRYPREPHAFILGLPLNDSDACPLVVWQGSHLRMKAALRAVIKGRDPRKVDVTDAYKAARAEIFETCTPVAVQAAPGQAILLDRFALHGVAPWKEGMTLPDEGRMIAYFRPQFSDPMEWLRG